MRNNLSVVNLRPTECNICNGLVEFITNDKIYGKKYGSGFAYRCTVCGAYVGTHEPRPEEALGILANKEMRELKMKCHKKFDVLWINKNNRRSSRKRLYRKLASEMNIPLHECHFGYFNLDMLKKAYDILTSWEINKLKRKD